jgi:futalosine hydrolase
VRLRERLNRLPRLLIVTAVEAERQAMLRGLGLGGEAADQLSARAPIVAVAAGVGPAAAAATASRMLTIAELTEFPFTLVVSAGIAGGFAPKAAIGATVLARRSIAADLGADSPDGFFSVDELGFGSSTVDVDADHLEPLRISLPEAVVGDVLTVSTVTGTADAAAALSIRHPDAVAEAMEGFGVASAARLAEVAFAELRTISNLIGPRDRATWRLAEALAALEAAAGALPAALLPASPDG